MKGPASRTIYAASDERRWRKLEPRAQPLRLFLADRPLAGEDVGDARPATHNLRQIGRFQAVMLHQIAQNLPWLNRRRRICIPFELVDQCRQQAQQRGLLRRSPAVFDAHQPFHDPERQPVFFLGFDHLGREFFQELAVAWNAFGFAADATAFIRGAASIFGAALFGACVTVLISISPCRIPCV